MWIEFDNVINARDLGGLPAADGRKVKPARLLRGAGLELASDRDVMRLQELQLRHIVDFRDARERSTHPDREIPGALYHSVAALPGLPGKPPEDGIPDFDAVFRSLYAALAESPHSIAAYREFFRILLDCREGAVYFHCAQGKDRTGIAAILVLSALGVPQHEIMADYFLSRVGLRAAMNAPPHFALF